MNENEIAKQIALARIGAFLAEADKQGRQSPSDEVVDGWIEDGRRMARRFVDKLGT